MVIGLTAIHHSRSTFLWQVQLALGTWPSLASAAAPWRRYVALVAGQQEAGAAARRSITGGD
jgi:hypothetical protein